MWIYVFDGDTLEFCPTLGLGLALVGPNRLTILAFPLAVVIGIVLAPPLPPFAELLPVCGRIGRFRLSPPLPFLGTEGSTIFALLLKPLVTVRKVLLALIVGVGVVEAPLDRPAAELTLFQPSVFCPLGPIEVI